MKRMRRRKCHACGVLYRPNPHTASTQCFCSAPACQKASHTASQRRWARRPQNRNYWRGPDQTERVRAWRRAHPGYARKPKLKPDVLQDGSATQAPAPQQDKVSLVLQDVSLAQPALLVGLIASLTGDTLQDSIAQQLRQLHHRGQQILGMNLGILA